MTLLCGQPTASKSISIQLFPIDGGLESCGVALYHRVVGVFVVIQDIMLSQSLYYTLYFSGPMLAPNYYQVCLPSSCPCTGPVTAEGAYRNNDQSLGSINALRLFATAYLSCERRFAFSVFVGSSSKAAVSFVWPQYAGRAEYKGHIAMLRSTGHGTAHRGSGDASLHFPRVSLRTCNLHSCNLPSCLQPGQCFTEMCVTQESVMMHIQDLQSP